MSDKIAMYADDGPRPIANVTQRVSTPGIAVHQTPAVAFRRTGSVDAIQFKPAGHQLLASPIYLGPGLKFADEGNLAKEIRIATVLGQSLRSGDVRLYSAQRHRFDNLAPGGASRALFAPSAARFVGGEILKQGSNFESAGLLFQVSNPSDAQVTFTLSLRCQAGSDTGGAGDLDTGWITVDLVIDPTTTAVGMILPYANVNKQTNHLLVSGKGCVDPVPATPTPAASLRASAMDPVGITAIYNGAEILGTDERSVGGVIASLAPDSDDTPLEDLGRPCMLAEITNNSGTLSGNMRTLTARYGDRLIQAYEGLL